MQQLFLYLEKPQLILKEETSKEESKGNGVVVISYFDDQSRTEYQIFSPNKGS